MGDDIRLRQILVNLLNNAVKYTHKGSITLEITRKQSEEGMAKLFFQVKDTGIGIKEEDKQRLFQAFNRVDLEKNHKIEGTGLGLSIAKDLLDAKYIEEVSNKPKKETTKKNEEDAAE